MPYSQFKRLYWLPAFCLALLMAADHAMAASVTVNSTTDTSDGDTSSISSLIADPGPDGSVSLREAIEAANNSPGEDSITFDIPGCGGVCRIQPLSTLPAIIDDGTTIDGYTQPGTSAATETAPATILIEIDGSSAGGANGLYITSSDNRISGLAINRFTTVQTGEGNGIYIHGPAATGNMIAGNYIGVDAAGSSTMGNEHFGILIDEGAQNNIIGGGAASARNIISGNVSYGIAIQGASTTSNTVSGNYIGSDASGTIALSNDTGIFIGSEASGNLIGGDTTGERNIISGNDGYGIWIHGSGAANNVVSGNYIGTKVNGDAALPNESGGVHIRGGAADNLVGGDSAGERNVISGNGQSGISLYGYNSLPANNTVSGNYIGVNASGDSRLGNEQSGISLTDGAHNNTIGGDTPGEGNVISANGSSGIYLGGKSDKITEQNTISANYIGLYADGTSTGGNMGDGIFIGSYAYSNVIGGDTPGERNVISGNEDGIHMRTNSGYGAPFNNTITGNYIGTDAAGTNALGNRANGVFIYLGEQNMIGGEAPGEGNVISGNFVNGVNLTLGANRNLVVGNHIGTDATGSQPLGNQGNGVVISLRAVANIIGPANRIAFNGYDGVHISDDLTDGNLVTRNRISSNHESGIDLEAGANMDIAAPTILSLDEASFIVTGNACAGCLVEIFANSDGDGEGETYLGAGTADAGGAFTVTTDPIGAPYLTATASGIISGTSEFSAVFPENLPDYAGSTKDVDKSAAQPGDKLVYTIELINNGTGNAAVSMTDPLPPGVTWAGELTTTSGTANWDAGANRVLWNGALSYGSPVTITFAAMVNTALPDGAQISNTASLESASGSPVEIGPAITIIGQGGYRLFLPITCMNQD